ncbi:MAG TPA: hypothetical protein VLB04_04775 [Methanotrichaceae archaeon]|nr:hypothetical protein [Methanotrichaceae archaeon]
MAEITRPQKVSQRHRLLDLTVIIVLVAYAVAAIVLFWQRPYLLALVLIPAPAVLVLRLGPIGLGIALAGAVLGPVTEIFCVAGGLWTYADTGGFPFIPPWLITIWACFPTALWLIVRSILGEIPPGRSGTLTLALAGIAVEIMIFVFLGDRTPLVIAAALPLAVAILLAWPEKSTLILMAAGSLLGPIAESLPIAIGAWSYAHPEILGMPAWLPLAYAMFAALLGYAAHDLSLRGRKTLP